MNLVIKRLLLIVRNHIDNLTWWAVIATVLLHMLFTWGVLWLANEKALLPVNEFFYYYIVTTSTVGYGDMSPTTAAGKWFVALLQIPVGLALFGVFLGKTGQTITNLIKRSMIGEKDFSRHSDHIIIFGWHPVRTAKMINYILADSKRVERRILLAVSSDMTHPFSDNPHVDFARLESYTDRQELNRIAITKADKVIIDGDDDNQTFTTALKISRLVKKQCHISAFFVDETKSDMLREHCQNVECSSSKSVEILVRSMQDPGSSRVQEELLSTLHGDTQFSLEVGKVAEKLTFEQVFFAFKKQYNATVLGIAHSRVGDGLDLNPPLDYPVKSGDILHYISVDRILSSEIDWQGL